MGGATIGRGRRDPPAGGGHESLQGKFPGKCFGRRVFGTSRPRLGENRKAYVRILLPVELLYVFSNGKKKGERMKKKAK